MSAKEDVQQLYSELLALQSEYEKQLILYENLKSQIDALRALAKDYETTINELEELKEGKEALVPMGAVLVKANLHEKVLVPLGANFYSTMKPQEAIEKLKEYKNKVEEEARMLEGEMGKLAKNIAAIEAKINELATKLKSMQVPTPSTGSEGSK